MKQQFLAFFSGFPNHHFPNKIVNRLQNEITQHNAIVFVSGWPSNYEKNDIAIKSIYNMFSEVGLTFSHCSIIDNRIEKSEAIQMVNEASCIFLMGGYPEEQLQLLRDKGLDNVLCDTNTSILGVSAGSINMAKRSLGTIEFLVPYSGLGLADITVKPHFKLDDEHLVSSLKQVSMELQIFAMEDYSAIFISDNDLSFIGKIYCFNKGEICRVSKDFLQKIIP